ncbi:MAG TPA: MarR family transcriptional regulator [Lacisediminihabitans sp.]|uniref:MarR family winged helix-turn-helix transcriptional regulator n=1 Tax=Lacisediminihabitans sp. TaxID=2787631 RepID=UPI002ED7F834
MSDTTTGTGTDDGSLGAELRTAVGRMYRRFRSERTAGELGDAAISVLNRLQKHGPQSLKALSDHAHVTPGSMSQTVNRLTGAGYAVRIPDPTDGRRVLFETTQEGSRIAMATLARSIAWLDTQLDSLTPSERETLAGAASLLRRIADS